jgi:hypothetical protein
MEVTAMGTMTKAKVGGFTLAAVLLLTLAAGCASETKTVKTETTQTPVATTVYTPAGPAPAVEQRTTQTTTTTTETKQESGGVLSSGVNFVGEVIAFPFRVIGAAFSALF